MKKPSKLQSSVVEQREQIGDAITLIDGLCRKIEELIYQFIDVLQTSFNDYLQGTRFTLRKAIYVLQLTQFTCNPNAAFLPFASLCPAFYPLFRVRSQDPVPKPGCLPRRDYSWFVHPGNDSLSHITSSRGCCISCKYSKGLFL